MKLSEARRTWSEKLMEDEVKRKTRFYKRDEGPFV
jgi:hypothetical protein